MKKAHKGLLVGGLVSTIFGGIGVVVGKLFLDKRTAAKAIGPKIAGEDDDDMGAENDPIIDVAKSL
jgi:hypothetical protein